MNRGLLVLLLALSGCVSFREVDFVVDLAAQTATYTYRDFTGSAGDLNEFVQDFLQGDALTSAFPAATVQSVAPVVQGEDLDVVVTLAFTDPYQVGIRPWDKRTPYRFCAPDGLVIVESNADFRDPDGCVVWKKGVKTLRVHALQSNRTDDPSLLVPFQDWDAAGRPALSE